MFEELPDPLAGALEQASDRLGTFGDVRYVSSVESTNDVALSLAASGAAEGTSVLADEQRRGRGRRGHTWFSPPGSGVYLSVIVRADDAVGTPPLLTLGAGVAAAEAVASVTGLRVDLKWPNDLVVGRPWRKVGGVLTEAVSAGGRSVAVVVGVGLNVGRAILPAALSRASAIELELGRPVDRVPIIVELLVGLRKVLGELRSGRADAVLDRWRALAGSGMGRRVRWRDARGDHTGIAIGVERTGALLVDVAGQVSSVVAGEVVWEDARHV